MRDNGKSKAWNSSLIEFIFLFGLKVLTKQNDPFRDLELLSYLYIEIRYVFLIWNPT